jgi:hypothetical protein
MMFHITSFIMDLQLINLQGESRWEMVDDDHLLIFLLTF